MKTKKGLSIRMDGGKLRNIISTMLVAAASVPISVTLSTALWDTCGGKRRQSESSLKQSAGLGKMKLNGLFQHSGGIRQHVTTLQWFLNYCSHGGVGILPCCS